MSLKDKKIKLIRMIYTTISEFDGNENGKDLSSDDYTLLGDYIDEIRAKIEELENGIYTETVVEERYG